MPPVNPLPVLQIPMPSGIGMLLGGLALGAFIALLVGFLVHRREQPGPAIDVAEPADAADKATRARLSA